MVFAAEFASISWVPASMLAAQRSRDTGGVNAGSIPQDLVVLAEPLQDRLVNSLPNTRLHRLVKATPACHAATATELTQKILPRYSRAEDEQDSNQGRSVIDARPSAFGGSTLTGKMSGYKRPKVFGEKCLGHDISPAVNRAAILIPTLRL